MAQQKRPALWRTQPKVITSQRTASFSSSSSSPALKRPPMLLLKKSDHISSENIVPKSPEQDQAGGSLFNKIKSSPKKKKAKKLSPTSPTISILVERQHFVDRAPSLRELQAQRKAKISHYGRRIGSAKSVPEKPLFSPPPASKKRCGWITPQSDPVNVAYHDHEWGVPVHNDKLLFELLTLASAQSELSWSGILAKRDLYRTAFSGFDPSILSTYDAARIAETRSSVDILQQDGKVESVIENARRVLQISHEFGSFDQYIWSFVNNKPIVTSFRMSSQVPIKSSRSEVMSKDLIQKGFRGVAPAIIYSFMQASGLTNDHIVHCFRHKEVHSHHSNSMLHSI
ncbi:uncharacterized protein LOC9656430 [Selaginella moellendorffii]|nr:uncharacterized protein LOC9656430 [Selaginella moellendorffii]|eukprot:XP_002977834.2 uncharacterized protein LOC9656430 [Selaginella moellendorffii]